MTAVIDEGDGASDVVDALIVGGGPAGLSAALNLGRARARVEVIDADRPRNAATMVSHGFLTRDGIPPHELRKLAREELAAYPDVRFHSRTRVSEIVREGDGVFCARVQGRTAPDALRARAVIAATGLRERLPEVTGIRGFYGMSLFSCAACDAWELQNRPLALIGETADLTARARLIARWTDDLIVFTHGAPVVSTVEEAELAAVGVRVERQRIAHLEGERGALEGVRLDDGTRVERVGGFVRPHWNAQLDFLDGVGAERDGDGHLVVDSSGRAAVPGLYGAGDAVAPGPQQLIVAAGQGARVAAVLVHDLVGVTTAH